MPVKRRSKRWPTLLIGTCPGRDAYRTPEFSAQFGKGSAFHQTYGDYFDAGPPGLPTLPYGWQQR